ncbi:MAG: aromatic amino acid transporter [Neisseriaceae bacterium]|nr:aromatic amino acid transporter [Neisseriaceae bacterium]
MKKPYFLGGIMIIAATIIGAGMLAIPIAGSGIWFYIATVSLVLSALVMMTSGLFILEVNLQYPQGASFNTIVKDMLGAKWNFVTGICIVFVLYTLIYAYITTGSSLTLNYFESFIKKSDVNISRIAITVGFTLFFAFFVWVSTKSVDRVSTILIILLIITFGLAVLKTLPNVNVNMLASSQPKNILSLSYWQYLPILLPVCLASFGFHGNVPSLVKYFQGDVKKVKYSICFGVMLALIVCFIWLLVIHGNIPRNLFQGIQNGQQDEVVVMLNLLSESIHEQKNIFKNIIQIFSFLALTSSFLGVALGLFDYFMDFFHLPESWLGRLMAGLVTFLPPLIFSIILPFGFTVAIGYVGLAAAVWVVIVPALLAKKSRQKQQSSRYQVAGGNWVVYLVIIFGIMNILSLLMVQFHLVERF